MKISLSVTRILLSLWLVSTITVVYGAGTGDSVVFNFSGRYLLATDPCQLDPETTDIRVDFTTVVKKELYLHSRTNAKPFTIRLTGCDTGLGSEVNMKFSGIESKLPGTLAVTGEATGIAIGMEKPDGTPLPFNKATPGYTLVSGTNNITLQAYVIGEPDAITAQTITAGDFTATATFELAYP
ncbi:TPA: fimbrial protein [Citrobacter freundii]